MADIGISVYESGRVREAFATLFDFQYVEFVGVAEDVSFDMPRCISVYDSATVTSVVTEFNEHLYTDPRSAYYPKLPAREGSGSFAKAISSDSLETPVRALSATNNTTSLVLSSSPFDNPESKA